MSDDKRAGILGSKRGPQRGYLLLKRPEDIKVYDIVSCTNDPIELVFCVDLDNSGESCGTPSGATSKGVRR